MHPLTHPQQKRIKFATPKLPVVMPQFVSRRANFFKIILRKCLKSHRFGYNNYTRNTTRVT